MVDDFDLAKILIYPNPVKDIAEITSNQEVKEYQVIDLSGRCVFEAQNTSVIDTSMFESGLYIIYVSMTNGQKARESFMKI